MKKILLIAFALMTLSACAGKKKVQTALKKTEEAELRLKNAYSDLEDCRRNNTILNSTISGKDAQLQAKDDELKSKTGRIKELEDQIDYLKKTSTNLLERLSDLSVVSKTGAESIRKSLESLNEQSRYIKNLNDKVQRKDSMNLVLISNLKRSLGGIADDDVQVEVKKGVVYISLSDKMLFKSGSAVISTQAESVLGKIAKILNDYREMEILVEGHTDNVPISTACMQDNWDLSVKRSVAVTRMLQNKFGVAPNRMIAGGRSEYVPKASNDTDMGKSLNRRTEIIITPLLDQFFELTTPQGK